ncbi:MAG: ASCH domain-containing protein [Geobacter sp.]|nr:MAG: ASCH domain-containing protein [Geobacter sp.]
MKALSLIQPWATAIMVGNKSVETRSWKTPFRGRIAIHASKGFPGYAKEFAQIERALGRLPGRLPFGAIIGFANIVAMLPTDTLVYDITPIERIYGDYSPGRWGWSLTDIEPLPDDKIIPCKGSLGLWDVPAALGLEG